MHSVKQVIKAKASVFYSWNSNNDYFCCSALLSITNCLGFEYWNDQTNYNLDLLCRAGVSIIGRQSRLLSSYGHSLFITAFKSKSL